MPDASRANLEVGLTGNRLCKTLPNNGMVVDDGDPIGLRPEVIFMKFPKQWITSRNVHIED